MNRAATASAAFPFRPTAKKPAEDPDDNLKPPAPRERKEQEPDPVPHLAGTSRQASIHVPAEALRDVAIDVSKLPKMTLLEE